MDQAELDNVCYVIGHDWHDTLLAVDMNAILSDYAGRFDPEKLTAKIHPARRRMRQEIPGWNFKHGPVNRLPGDGLPSYLPKVRP